MSVVVITGSNSGFGLQGALAFARRNYTVYATMRDLTKAGALEQAAGGEKLDINVRPLDVSRPDTFVSFIDHVIAEAGSVDVLVNNAGVFRPCTAEDTSESSLRAVMDTNFFGPVLMAQAVLPHMRDNGGGHIIMVSSLSGIAGLPGEFSYAASKFALEGATEAMCHEVDRWGVKVALVEAGMHATDILRCTAPSDSVLPEDYPADSPYRTLIESNLKSAQSRLSAAFDPRAVGELFVKIAESDGSQLRWPADSVARDVLATLFGQSDTERDEYLRKIAGTAWWSDGKEAAD